jgi:3-hydroxyacyl-[acyl-carrier-protein] dehydratase
MTIKMDINQIMQQLPHRYPFLLIDRVLSIDPGKEVVALKNVSINEPFFPGHYPHHPVMPGVLVIEAMAQTAAILTFTNGPDGKPDESKLYYFVGIDGARFKRPVVPGDQLIMKAEIIRSMRGVWKFRAVAEVDGMVAAESEIMCTVRDK